MTDAVDYTTCRYCGADLDEERALAAHLQETQLPYISCGMDTGGTARCFECDSSAWCETCDGPYLITEEVVCRLRRTNPRLKGMR